MSSSGEVPGVDQGNPVSRAVFELATDIHSCMLRDLGRPIDEIEGTFDLEAHRQRYPFILFGELAMSLADVKLPDNATAPDRARGIIEALHRISITPSLLVSVTNAPFSSELTSKLAVKAPEDDESAALEAKDAGILRAAIRKSGFLEKSMVPNGRAIKLKYQVDPDVKPSRIGRTKPVAGSTITLKLAPADEMVWKITKFSGYNQYEGAYFGKKLGEREFRFGDIFTLIAAVSSERVPSKLSKLIGENVQIGRVSSSTKLSLNYGFSRYTKESPGREHEEVSCFSVTLPAQLQQAYLGDSFDFPLFHENY